mgnify:CR=1 FL=1
MNSYYIPLDNRAILTLKGDDARSFLQGIITNDINKVNSTQSIYTCLLTPQGKFLYDFFIAELNGDLIIDCEKSRKDELVKKLMMYRLRSKVSIEDISDKFQIAALVGENVLKQDGLVSNSPGKTISFCKGVAFIDPRTDKMFARSVIERSNDYKSFEAKGFVLGSIEDYEYLRIANAVPNGIDDMLPDKSFPLHNRMDELNAIDFKKGCYVGQEVTARSKHRGNIRKSLFVISESESAFPEIGSALTVNNGKTAGNILSRAKDKALAILDKDVLQEENIVFSEGKSFKVI